MILEKRLPFIGAIVSGLILAAATFLFLRDYFLYALVVVIAAIIFVRFEPWALIGSFLTGLAIELYSHPEKDGFQIIVAVLVIGTVIQIIASFFVKPEETPYRRASTVGQNMVFALIGVTVSRLLFVASCPPPDIPLNLESGLFNIFIGSITCHMQYGLQSVLGITDAAPETLAQVDPNIQADPATWIALSLLCVRVFSLSPLTWAALGASLRQIRFNPFKIGALLGNGFKAFWGIFLLGIASWVFIIPAFAFAFYYTQEATLTVAETIWSYFLIYFFTVDTFFTALGAAWGASWGN